MTLYEMTEAENNLYELLENGEIDEQTVADTMEAIGLKEKLESYAKVINQMKADVEMLTAEKKKLDEKAKRCEKAIDRLKSAVLMYLENTNQEKATAGVFSFRVSKSMKVIVDDVYSLPEDFVRYQEPEANKTAIKEAIANGIEVKGAHIEQTKSVVLK